MIYEKFFRWLFSKRNKRRSCKHEWAETGITYSSSMLMFSDSHFRHHYKCDKCGKKEKRTPQDTHGTHIYY